MRTINNRGSILSSVDPVDMLTALIVRELQNLGKSVELDAPQVVKLEKLGNLYMKISANNREEYALLIKSGINKTELSSATMKELEKLLLGAEKGDLQ